MRSEFVEAELKQTLFNNFDVRVKFITLFCLAILGIAIDTWQALCVVYAFVIFMVILSRISASKVKVLILFTFLTVWGLMWLQAIFYDGYPKTKLFYIISPMVVDPSTPIIGGLWKGLGFYYEGFIYGIMQSLRILIPMTYGMLIFWTEEPIRILVGLNKMKLPYTISFMVMTCLRFIPITFSEAKVTLNSQRLKKYKPLDLKGIIFLYGIYNTVVQTMVPLLANCIRKSVNMAKSADSRAFRSSEDRTQLREIKMNTLDKFAIVFVVAITFAITLLELLYYFQDSGIYYNNGFLPLYWFAENFI